MLPSQPPAAGTSEQERQTAELTDVLSALEAAADEGERTSVHQIRDHLGSHGIAASLLILGLLAVSPVGDIPGVPTVMAVLIFAAGIQLAMGKDRLWLPGFLGRRTVRSAHIVKAVRFMRPVLRFVGRFVGRRLTALVTGPGARIVGVLCALLALSLPPLEFIPFGATIPSGGIAVFGLALTTQDGVLAAIAFAATAGTLYLLARVLL